MEDRRDRGCPRVLYQTLLQRGMGIPRSPPQIHWYQAPGRRGSQPARFVRVGRGARRPGHHPRRGRAWERRFRRVQHSWRLAGVRPSPQRCFGFPSCRTSDSLPSFSLFLQMDYFLWCWRAISAKMTDAAVETLKEFTWPYMGMDTMPSQVSFTTRETPSPSLPMTRAQGPEKSVS